MQSHEVCCALPNPLVHQTIIVLIEGMQADDQSDPMFRAWLEETYGHVVLCSYGYRSFDGTVAVREIARTLKPLRHESVNIVLVGCSKGFLTMCEVFQRLQHDGFAAPRFSLVVADGARGHQNVILIPPPLVRLAPLATKVRIGPRLSALPGRWIVKRYLAGEPRQERHWLQQLHAHVCHVLTASPDLSGARQLVYLTGMAAHNGVLAQPAEQQAVVALAARFGVETTVIAVPEGGHCDFDRQQPAWQRAFSRAFEIYKIRPLSVPLRQASA